MIKLPGIKLPNISARLARRIAYAAILSSGACIVVLGFQDGIQWIALGTLVFTIACGMSVLRSNSEYGLSRAHWRHARTMPDVGELTAQWLEGRLPGRPAYYGRPDEGIRHITFPLTVVNRAGYVTDAFQPQDRGVNVDGTRWVQRAAVAGFADDNVRDRLVRLADKHGFTVIEYRGRLPWRRKYIGETVTTIDGEAFASFGHVMSRRDFSFWRWYLPAAAVHALKESWQITLIDPEWEPASPNRLWAALLVEFDG